MEHFPERFQEARAYAEFLKSAGIERGLIGPREADRIWERHILNCIPVSTLMKNGATVIDIGSGAGLPGVVIALARPDLKVTLLEPLARRIDFLNGVASELGLDITIKKGKAESEKGLFDLVTGRAVAPLPKFVEISWHLVKPGGAILAMKGEAAQAEIEAFKAGKPPKNAVSVELHQIKLGDLEPSRIVEVRKAG